VVCHAWKAKAAKANHLGCDLSTCADLANVCSVGTARMTLEDLPGVRAGRVFSALVERGLGGHGDARNLDMMPGLEALMDRIGRGETL
jgi:hypothetical protein